MASVRAATPDDYGLFTRFYATFDAPGPTPNREWWERSYGDALFVEESGEVVGYAFAYRLGRELGHVAHLVVDERARGRGLGLVVMNAVRDRLRTLGCSRWSLYVNEENEAAVALYRRCGMRVTNPVDEILVTPANVRALPVDPSVVVEPLSTTEDADVERRFGLPEGRIARVRRLPERTFFVARRGGETIGTISFEPSDCSTPFLCAETEAVARALVEAVARDVDVRVFLNDDAALSDALVRVGGRVVRHMLQMDGALA